MITIQDIEKLVKTKLVPFNVVARGMELTPMGLRSKIRRKSQPNTDQITTLLVALQNFESKNQENAKELSETLNNLGV